MRRSRLAFAQMALALLLLSGPSLASAAGPTSVAKPVVVRVVVIQTDNLSAYLQELERGKAMLKRLGSPAEIRVFQARFAGADAGAVVVTVEFPSLEALAESDAKALADTEYMAWIKGLDKVRKIVSDSLYGELETS